MVRSATSRLFIRSGSPLNNKGKVRTQNDHAKTIVFSSTTPRKIPGIMINSVENGALINKDR